MTMRNTIIGALLMTPVAVLAANEGAPRIGTMDWTSAQTVCVAWPEGITWEEARQSGVVWIGFPVAVKPFGMRGYMRIDGRDEPLKQIAYAHPAGTLNVYYRTLGERHHDVYLNLSGLDEGTFKGSELTGTLVVSRFGLFSELKIAGSCGVALP